MAALLLLSLNGVGVHGRSLRTARRAGLVLAKVPAGALRTESRQ